MLHRIIGRLSLVLATLLLAGGAHGYILVTTSDGTPIAWYQRCIEIWTNPAVVAERTPDEVQEALELALATWSSVDCTWIGAVARGFTCFDHVGLATWPGAQNEVLSRDAPGSWRHPYRVVALTSLTYDKRDGALMDADIELNGEDYSFAVDGSVSAYDLQQTLTHELGHVFGLDHTPVVSATMYALSYAGEISKRSLAPDDVAGICANHPLSTTPATPACEYAERVPAEAPWCPKPPAPDCAAGGGEGAMAWVFGLGLLLILRRRTRSSDRCA